MQEEIDKDKEQGRLYFHIIYQALKVHKFVKWIIYANADVNHISNQARHTMAIVKFMELRNALRVK